jgi:hypothetical protein
MESAMIIIRMMTMGIRVNNVITRLETPLYYLVSLLVLLSLIQIQLIPI